MSVAKYYPFNGERGRLRLGVNPIAFSEWIQYEDDFVDRIREKKSLIQNQRRCVLEALPSSILIQEEFLYLVLSYLQKFHRKKFSFTQDKVESKLEKRTYTISEFKKCPLELTSYLVADDYCLLEEQGEDFRLIAASVCTPTWWNLSEKMGKLLTDIHAPIANLEEKIGRMIRHFLNNLKVEDCYQRSNWFLFTSSDLCVFPESFDFNEEMSSISTKNIETQLYLRSERQTFRRLRNSGCIVFGIKVYIEPISLVKKYPKIAQDLISALDTMSIDQKRSLGINFVEKPLRCYLSSVLQ